MDNRKANWTPAEYQQFLNKQNVGKEKGNRQKFGNVEVMIDGIRFQSTKEGKYYGTLKMRLLAKEIIKFRRQVRYKLAVNGHHICDYIADFEVHNLDGSITVIDVKSEATEHLSTFRMKKDLMWAIHRIKIKIC